jgi:UDP-N-acetylglucosamine--N-acetylmuramyl-(pentapeptide) pyrophosphoryl-undecaprenol N-acetylglucosamine transferase
VYPGIALAHHFQVRCPGAEVSFLGLRGGLEEQLVPREGFPLRTVHVQALKGRSVFAQVGALAVLGIGTLQALHFMWRLRPHLIIGTGGYVMGPAVLAATLLRQPRVLLEQNLFPGMTVRMLARFAHRVFTAFPETAAYLPTAQVECTGNPVRQDICAGELAEQPHANSGFNLLIFGGSQGAHRINQAVVEALSLLHKHPQVRIVHQTGSADYDVVAQAYRRTSLEAEVHPFLYDIATRYHWAHLVICRAGATTLAELTACGKPAILIPYPYAAADHQRLNAMALQRQGAAQVILDAELTGARLYEVLRQYVERPEKLRVQAECSRRLGRPQAADTIVTACLRLLHAEGN